jgi:large subunit ribosomal protein L10
MNREQKAATIEALAAEIDGSEAVFAVDYRGISVSQAAELRTRLREADATFQVVKNSLTERAADQVGAESLKALLIGPTALTFVRGDAALAAKAIADQARATQLLPFKGGLMNGEVLDAEQIRSISRLPSREVLYGQLVGVVASPISGLVRTLGGLLGGLAVALGQVREKKESGEISGADGVEEAGVEETGVEETGVEETGVEETGAEGTGAEEAVSSSKEAAPRAREEADSEDAPADSKDAPPDEAPAAVADEASSADRADPADEPAQDDNKTDASAPAPEGAGETESAEATKED